LIETAAYFFSCLLTLITAAEIISNTSQSIEVVTL